MLPSTDEGTNTKSSALRNAPWLLVNGAETSKGHSKNEMGPTDTAARSREQTTIMAPFNYLKAKPGKDFRRQVLVAFNFWLQVDEEAFSTIDRVVDMLHNASLLIDDIQDGSKFRRGSPAAHIVFGVAQTINAANYVYFLAQQELSVLENSTQALQIFNEELINLHHGQGIELFWRDTLTVPSEKDYYRIISNKTGGLFRLAARLLQYTSRVEDTHDIILLADKIGLIFQIRDDYRNLSSTAMATEKG